MRELTAVGIPDAEVIGRAPGESGWPVWHVRHRGREYALRVLPEAVAVREAMIHRVAAAGGVPVPRVCAEAPGLLLVEWCPGVPLLEVMAARSDALGRAFGEMQASIHALAAPPGLRAMGPVAGPRLLHGDYHPLNVLTDGERITAVLDWTNAAAGDPRTDVARTLSILRLEGRVPGRFPLELRRVLAPFERAWLAGYGGDLPDAIFRAWAGAFMADDMAAKRPPDHIARVRRWAGADAVNVVSEAFAAMTRGDLATVRRLVAPDLEWTYLDPSFESPEPQVCHGREELEAGLRRRAAHGLHPQLEEVAGRGDRVLVVEHTPGLDARRARQAGDRNFYVATVREGRITALRACRSRAEAAALVNQ